MVHSSQKWGNHLVYENEQKQESSKSADTAFKK